MTTLMRAVAVGGTAVAPGRVRVRPRPVAAGRCGSESVHRLRPRHRADLQDLLLRVPRAEEGPRPAAPERRRSRSRRGGESGAVITPGKSADSLMMRRVLGLDGDDRMPLDGDPLPADAIARLRAWIDQGARVSEPGSIRAGATHRAGARQSRGALGLCEARRGRALPAVKSAAWVRNPIDQFVLARLEKEALAPAARGARRRRCSGA